MGRNINLGMVNVSPKVKSNMILNMADKSSSPQTARSSLIVAMVVVLPFAMILGMMQIDCFPYSSLRNISYGIALSMALVSAIWIIYAIKISAKAVASEQRNIGRRFKMASIKLFAVLLVAITSALITGLFSWMLIGDAVYFSSKQPREYVTTVTKSVLLKNCSSGVEFFEESLGHTIVMCPGNGRGKSLQGEQLKIKTRTGHFGVRIMSVNKIQ